MVRSAAWALLCGCTHTEGFEQVEHFLCSAAGAPAVVVVVAVAAGVVAGCVALQTGGMLTAAQRGSRSGSPCQAGQSATSTLTQAILSLLRVKPSAQTAQRQLSEASYVAQLATWHF